ncbi:hypothetical protein [Limosilactobacillus antri]|uniref:hypothetical protein n=1 Tax=Limosilactobacillus antri TaxID=227943 RepID=UPI001F59A7EF|nr:hypothetical protein [Limosilactobacillus antri]
MSISNPETFDYLKVETHTFDSNDNEQVATWPLTCVDRNSVHVQYSDNATYSISFDIHNDDSPSFKFFNENAIIIAGEQLFHVTQFQKKLGSVGSASVSADQIVNSDFQRVVYNGRLTYSTDSKGNLSDHVYANLPWLLKTFQNGAPEVNKQTDMLGFSFQIHGYFPIRQIKEADQWNGKQLLSTITQVWPGTVIIGWGRIIHIYGYQDHLDATGNTVNVRDIETGIRFDNLKDLHDLSVNYDRSKLCNAIKVKSATYSLQPDNDSSDDSSDDTDMTNESIFQNLPYFPNFVAFSKKSVDKYGLYMSDSVLDNGFTNKKAAEIAAREKMVLDPAITVTGTLNNPGRTQVQPVPGQKYTIGVAQQENKIFHVILRGYDWYPFNSTKGVTMTLNSVDMGILDHLRSTIIHDAELSPAITQFKALTYQADNSADDEVDTDDDANGLRADDFGDGTESDDVNEDPDSSENDDDLDDDADSNNSTSSATTSVIANLPISDKGTSSNINSKGDLSLNISNGSYNIRVGNNAMMKAIQVVPRNITDSDNQSGTPSQQTQDLENQLRDAQNAYQNTNQNLRVAKQQIKQDQSDLKWLVDDNAPKNNIDKANQQLKDDTASAKSLNDSVKQCKQRIIKLKKQLEKSKLNDRLSKDESGQTGTGDENAGQDVGSDVIDNNSNSPQFKRLMSVDYNKPPYYRYTYDDHNNPVEEKNVKNHYQPADFYLGQTMIGGDGAYITQAPYITFIAHASDKDLDGNGYYKRTTKKHDDGRVEYLHFKQSGDNTNVGDEHPTDIGQRATIFINNLNSRDNPGGNIYCHSIGVLDESDDASVSSQRPKHVYSETLGSHYWPVDNLYVDTIGGDNDFGKVGYAGKMNIETINVNDLHARNTSQLSKKKNVEMLSKSKALNTILNTDIATYKYKYNKQDNDKHASIIIDDVNDKPKFKTPSAFISNDGKSRLDDVTIGYLVKAIQAQQDQIDKLQKQVDDLKNQLNDD